MKFKFGKLPVKYAPNSEVCELSVLECFRLAVGFFTTKHGNESMLPYTNPPTLDVIFNSCWIDFQIQFKCDIILFHSFLVLLQGGLLQLHSPTHKDQLDFRVIGFIRKLRLKSLSYKASLIEKLVRCAQLLCDGCPLRLGGDSGATARAFLTVQNDVYTTGVMM
jgi:hypothetical protein